MKKSIIKIIVILFAISFAGCEDNYLNLEPVGQQTVDDLFEDTDGVLTALNAAYAPFQSLGATSQGFLMAIEEKSDDGYHGRSDFEFESFIEEPFNPIINETWLQLFTSIQRANLIISRIDEVPFLESELDKGVDKSIKGQAYFIRALAYWWLVNMWGDVPIFTDYSANPDDARIPKDPMKDVYDQIKSDLADAIMLLKVKSEYDDTKGFSVGMATKGSAQALLAEVHLLLEEWQQAVDVVDQIINSGEYDLYPKEDYINNFQGRDENGKESIFEIQYTDDLNGVGSSFNTWYGLPGLVQGNGRYGLIVTDDNDQTNYPGSTGNGFIQAIEQGDMRIWDISISNYDSATNPIDSNLPPAALVNKYFTGTATFSGARSYVNYTVLRYSRLLLTKAEALNELGAGNAEAIEIIDNIRDRAGLSPLDGSVTSDQQKFREAIWHERRMELCFEGTRYFDLLRTGRLIPIVEGMQGTLIRRERVIKHPITQKDWYLWPIPQDEINTNPQMKQNPGY